MRFYELTYLLSSDIQKDDLKNLSDKINSFIIQENGLIKQTTEARLQKLAYQIKKKAGAYLLSINFTLNPESLEKIEKKLKEEGQILRYIILTKDSPEKIAQRSRTRFPLRSRASQEKITPRVSTSKIGESQKIELKEIDKKIEEILNQ